jgi:hypothetical protein
MRLKYVGQSHFPDHTKDIARGEEALFFSKRSAVQQRFLVANHMDIFAFP